MVIQNYTTYYQTFFKIKCFYQILRIKGNQTTYFFHVLPSSSQAILRETYGEYGQGLALSTSSENCGREGLAASNVPKKVGLNRPQI